MTSNDLAIPETNTKSIAKNKKKLKEKTNSEAADGSDVINQIYQEQKFLKIDGHLSILEKDYSEF